MSKEPVTVSEDAPVLEAAKIMKEKGIGGLVVVSRLGKPVGIITERDLVVRVMAENRNPGEVAVKDIMSSPIITIDPERDLLDAMEIMARKNIRRLVVMDKDKLVGMITEKDILRVAPGIIEILRSKIETMGREPVIKEKLAGYCDNCGEWSDSLEPVDDQLLCEECRLEYGIIEE